MSFYSNHEPESIDACRFDEDPSVPRCECEIFQEILCPFCRADYEAWSRQFDEQLRAEYEAIQDVLPEPSGQQFLDDLPF